MPWVNPDKSWINPCLREWVLPSGPAQTPGWNKGTFLPPARGDRGAVPGVAFPCIGGIQELIPKVLLCPLMQLLFLPPAGSSCFPKDFLMGWIEGWLLVSHGHWDGDIALGN